MRGAGGAVRGAGPGAWSGALGPLWPLPPGSSEEEEEEAEADGHWGTDFVPGCGAAPFALYGPRRALLGPPLLVPPPPLADVRGPGAAWRHRVTAEEAEKNAKELVAEEERMKKKAEKKKLKKKKQKDRRKQEKLEQELKCKQDAESSASSQGSAAGTAGGAGKERGCPAPSPSWGLGENAEEGAGDPEQMEDELDLSCTFVFKARQKAGVRLPVPGKDKAGRGDAAEPDRRRQEGAPEPPLPCPAAPQVPELQPAPLDADVVEQSLVLAGRGNEAAQQGRYQEAVQAFTEAVRLNPREHRLFGNRSYCYEKLQRYEEALRDAQVSLGLQPAWPKGLFRKGKALRGLQRYAEAVDAFEQLLRVEGAHADAAAQLEACRALLQQSSLHGAGSPRDVPVLSPLEAGQPLTPLSEQWVNGSCCDTDLSGFVTVVNSRSHSKSQARAAAVASPQHALPPQHPARDCYPLWVGNVTSKITEEVLQGCFSRFGQIQSIRMLPGKYCAFINFRQKAAAEAAYGAMLDAELEGSRLALQLKHPSHATPPPRQRP